MEVIFLYSLGQDAIVMADLPENEVVQNQPDAVAGVQANVVAADQPVPDILETGNSNKRT